jgi:hypothetical protein
MLWHGIAQLDTDDLPDLPFREGPAFQTAIPSRLSVQRSQYRAVAL